MEDAHKVYKIASKIVIDRDGQDQTIWHNIGSLVIYDNGTGKMRLNMFPSEQYHIFDKDLRRVGDEMTTGQQRVIARARELAES